MEVNEKKRVFHASDDVQLASGHPQLILNVNQQMRMVVRLPEHSQGVLMVFVKGQGHLDLALHFGQGAHWDYLWVNQSDETLDVSEHLTLQQDVVLKASYGEFSDGSHNKETEISLLGEGAHIDVRSAMIVGHRLQWVLRARHRAKRTYAMLSSYGIASQGAELSLDVEGHIYRGNKGSETHQVSRILNLDPQIKSVVYPKLLIDEHDVAASHAASVGQPNPDHLYYLESRGLNHEAALGLIVMGYLLPVVAGIEDETVRQQLQEQIGTKVGHHALV